MSKALRNFFSSRTSQFTALFWCCYAISAVAILIELLDYIALRVPAHDRLGQTILAILFTAISALPSGAILCIVFISAIIAIILVAFIGVCISEVVTDFIIEVARNITEWWLSRR